MVLACSLLYWMQDQSEIVADQTDQFGVEAGLLAIDSNLEWRVGESRDDP
jgi:hypothetical protein